MMSLALMPAPSFMQRNHLLALPLPNGLKKLELESMSALAVN
jgi:hypothetical protein